MVSIKVFALLAVVVVASQAYPNVAAPRDLRVVIANAIKVLRVIGDAVEQGIEDATAPIQAIEAEMNPDLAAKVKGLLLRAKTDVGNLNANVRELEAQVQKSQNNVAAAAGACVDIAEAELEPILNKFGGALAALISQIGDDNREELDSVYSGVKDLGERLHATNMANTQGGEACVVNKKDVKSCLDANSDSFVADITGGLADGVLLLNEALPLINTTLTAFVNGLQPGLNDTRAQADAVIAKFGTCVESS